MKEDIAPIIGIMRHRIMIDGNGVCTLVAFHSCPLRCKYCLNAQCLTQPEKFKTYSAQEICDEVKKDNIYFQATGGGITFGGGEPALRSHLIAAFRELCGSKWQIGLETSLNVPQHHLLELIPVIDHYMIDIKDMNPEIYRQYTGKDNSQVIQNLHVLQKLNKAEQVIIRIPLIPDFNTASDQEKSKSALQEMGFKKFDLFTYQKKQHHE